MAKTTEVRMSQGAAIFLAIVVIGAIMFFAGAFETTTTTPSSITPSAPLQVVPAIEKTKLYLATYNEADYLVDGQKIRVNGSVAIIKSGNLIETTATSLTASVATTAEFNGGDTLSFIGDAPGYYAGISEDIKVMETLQYAALFIRAEGDPTVTILDNKKDALSPLELTLMENEDSKIHYISIERPGNNEWFQFCGIAADFDSDETIVRVKDQSGSFVEGQTDLADDFDYLKGEGHDAVWTFSNADVKNFDEMEIAFIIGTEKDVLPDNTTVSFEIFDCEYNLQNGEIVYTNEDSSDADLGIANIVETITVNP